MIMIKCKQRIEERYDLSKIRSYMDRLGFKEVSTPLTYEYEYSGLIAFVKDGWKIEFNYPPETLNFLREKGSAGGWCCISWSDIKSINCDSRKLDIVLNNGNDIHIWAR